MEKNFYIKLKIRKKIIFLLRKEGFTFQQIGKIFGISRQRVHQIFWGKENSNGEEKNKMEGRDFLAEKVRQRDNYTCQICGKKWKPGMRRFDVHHLDEEKENNRSYVNYKNFNRMITLCHKCHLNLPHIREKMKKNKKSLIQDLTKNKS